jgi:hypothetical protein
MYCSPTHEEAVTSLVAEGRISAKDLPLRQAAGETSVAKWPEIQPHNSKRVVKKMRSFHPNWGRIKQNLGGLENF